MQTLGQILREGWSACGLSLARIYRHEQNTKDFSLHDNRKFDMFGCQHNTAEFALK